MIDPSSAIIAHPPPATGLAKPLHPAYLPENGRYHDATAAKVAADLRDALQEAAA